MANIVYFEIPAEEVDRAKRFYNSLLGWKIEPTKAPDPEVTSMEYQDVITGETKEVTPMGCNLSMGGICQLQAH